MEVENRARAVTDDQHRLANLVFRASVVDNAQQAIVVTDVHGVVSYWNRYAMVMYGWTMEEAIGRSVMELIVSDPHVEHAESVMRSLRAGNTWRGEFEVRRKDGSTFVASVLDIPLLDDAGQLAGIVGVSEDTSERRQSGAAWLVRGQLQRALDVAKMGAWSWSLAEDHVQWSDEVGRLLGLEPRQTPRELAGWLAMVHSEDRAQVERVIANARAGDAELDASFRVIGPNLVTHHVHLKGARELGVNGEPVFVGVVQDISDRVHAEQANHRLQQQLAQTHKIEAIGRLAGGVAHDINNLLGGITLFGSLMRDHEAFPPQLVPKIEAILELCKRGGALSRNLLSFARRGDYQLGEVDVRAMIEDTVALLRRTVSKQIEFELDIEAELPWWWGDRAQLHQLIMNLCLNGIDALRGEGRLYLRAARDRVETEVDARELAPGDYVRVDVIDNGCGMDEHTQARVFEPFFTTKREGQGSGLGLSMAHGTVHSHGGAIMITSAIGRGTTVSVWVPCATADLIGSMPDEAKPAKSAVGRARVLLVEDEPAIREAASELIEQLGYEVVCACDGVDAQQRFRAYQGQFAAVILDLVMPRADGSVTFHALRREDPQLPIVITSGHSAPGTITQLLEAGAAGFLQKPFSSASLAQALARSARHGHN